LVVVPGKAAKNYSKHFYRTGRESTINTVNTTYKKYEVSVHQLKFGMFVRELDRPWLDSPFKFQGFYIHSIEDVLALKKICSVVYIDLDKSRHLESKVRVSHESKHEKKILERREQFWVPDSHLLKDVEYPDEVCIEDELVPAIEARSNAVTAVESLYADIRSGSSITTAETKKAVTGLVDSIIRNPDAHALLALLEECDAQRLVHSLNVCTLSLALGRMLGFPRQYMIELGLGALLHDIGQAKIPKELVTREGALTDEEYEVMKKHAALGMELLLDEERHLPYRAIDAVYTHHERYDGYGYPEQIRGDSIPLYGRIVAIADFYEAITGEHADKEKLTPGAAMTQLYALRNMNFDACLVEEFIKCVGIFPIGCAVLLSTGELGIVITQNRKSRLEPKLMLILDKNKQFYPVPRLYDISLFKKNDEKDVRVTGIVDPGEYEIDVKSYLGDLVGMLESSNEIREGT